MYYSYSRHLDGESFTRGRSVTDAEQYRVVLGAMLNLGRSGVTRGMLAEACFDIVLSVLGFSLAA
jgi:hypothetical protein